MSRSVKSQIAIRTVKPENPGDIILTRGTRLFINGTEVQFVESMSFKTDFGKFDDIPMTTLTFTVCGIVDMIED